MPINFSNHSKNNISFGRYDFYPAAKELLKEKIKTNDELDIFKVICEKENAKQNREINISTNSRRSRLTANYGDGWHKQGFFQKTLDFLESISKKADEFDKIKDIKTNISNVIDSL